MIKHILCATDFTETSARAIDYAASLAKGLNVPVTVVHAYEIPVYGFPDGALIATAEITQRITQAAQEALDKTVKDLVSRGVEAKGVLRTGAPWDEVISVGQEQKADMIIIGTHGRKGLARALLGSVAENVIRTSTIPVLVIHGPRDEKKK
jgi:nucleotide-binding universal stress UspA family protein